MTKRRLIVLGLVVIVLVLVAIPLLLLNNRNWNPEVRLGWAGSHTSNHMQYQYARFSGDETVPVDVSGSDMLSIDYALTVTDGRLELRVLADQTDTVLWQEAYTAEPYHDHGGTVEVTVADQDRVHIRVVGDAAAGAFELTWVTS